MDNKTIDTYNRLAEEYDRGTADFWADFPSIFLDKFAELAKGKVLDLGSGPGRDAVLLNQRGLAVTCLDASQTMAEMSRKIGFDSVVADMESIPFQDNCFDGVWAYTSLLHVPKSDFFKSVREIKRVLKNQGVLL